MDLGGRFPPARSIPNLPNETCSIAPSTESYALARSSSQPAEMWGRNIIARSDHIHQFGESVENVIVAKPIGVSISTQTDTKLDLPAIEKFIVSNPRLVLNLLGIIEPSYEFECELQPQTLIPIPEADVSSPEATSPPESHAKKYTFGGGSTGVNISSSTTINSNPMETASSPSVTAVWNSPHNSNNKNTENCRSTDALLGNSSDDCLLPSDEHLPRIPTLPETINFSIVREGSQKSRTIVTNCSRSSSMNSLSSTTQTTTPKQSITDLSASSVTTQRNHHGHLLKRKQSWKDNNNVSQRKSSTTVNATPTDSLTYSGNDADIDPEDDNTNFDELNEKCALLCNDVRKNSNGRSSTSTSDIQKRNHLVPRPPYSYRFSAGDADKLEKGIKNIPSTRSLKDS